MSKRAKSNVVINRSVHGNDSEDVAVDKTTMVMIFGEAWSLAPLDPPLMSYINLDVLMYVGGVSQEVVSCGLKLRQETELLQDARTHVVEVFPRLEKPDDPYVAGRFV